MLFGFVIACGFVTAGLLNALHLAVQGNVEEPPANGMVLYFHSPGTIFWSMFVCVFAGPYLVVSQSLRFWKAGHVPFAVLAFCGLISLIWSFCSGVFVIEAAHALGFVVG